MGHEPLRELSHFAAEMDLQDLSAAILEKASACLLYALTVGMAGTRMPQADQALAAFDGASIGNATRFLDGRRCDASTAAFANATLFHVRVQDDAHPAGHVGVVVNPTALAMAETTGASGAELLAAIIVGYEVALRIGRDHAADLSARGFRTTPCYGVFGAAAAAGRLLGLNAKKMEHALSLAANMAAGLREYSVAGSNEYAFHAGSAAANGIVAARLAAAGATSAPTALNGAAGFFLAYGKSGCTYDTRIAERLGTAFEISAVTYKPYPICQFHRGIVRGCSELRERAGVANLELMTVRMHPFEADFFGVRFAGPFTSFSQAFMSAPFCAALAWVKGTATLSGLTDFADGDIQIVLPRIQIIADAGCERYGPHLVAQLGDGTELQWQERSQANAYTLTWSAATDMTAILSREVGIKPALAQELIDAIACIRDAPSVQSTIEAMEAACRSARERD